MFIRNYCGVYSNSRYNHFNIFLYLIKNICGFLNAFEIIDKKLLKDIRKINSFLIIFFIFLTFYENG